MAVDKSKLRKQFAKDWKKHYKVEALEGHGFQRGICENCGQGFWSVDANRKRCADSTCVGYQFIGKKTNSMGYVETWNAVEKYFKKTGHESIPRYPTVCRWRDDLYFTNASIIDFQPYVVTGEIQPPANPLVVPQTSIRFVDTGNVGVTGRHYTSFIMVGQHAFNNQETGLFYWKNEALEHDLNILTKVLGTKKEEIVFQEDVWAGGGTFGPSMEYCVNGIELGNCVFMQYKDLGNGKSEELNTKVIDMGAGLERFAWFTNGSPTSYEITFGDVIQKMKKDAGVHYDEKLFTEYAKLSGILDVDEQGTAKKRKEIAKQLHKDEEELFGMLKPLQGLYAIADHLKTLLYTTTDGMLPSNGGGGYNLRMIARRVFSLDKEFDFNLDYAKIVQGHAKHLKDLDPTLQEGVATLIDLLKEEEQKYADTQVKAGKKLTSVFAKAKANKKLVTQKEMITLYESDGIPLEMIEDKAQQEKVKLEEVENFYGLIQAQNEIKKEKTKYSFNLKNYKNTKELHYEDQNIQEFTGKVLGVEGNFIILDQTCFYPTSGGQEHDTGLLNDAKVSNVIKEEGVILHEVNKPERFKKGMKVFGKIDWERRYLLTRVHTGAHVLNAAARELLGSHIWQASAYKSPEKGHLDVTHYRRITDEQVKQMELIVQKWITNNTPVEKKYYARDKAEKDFGFRIYQGGYVPGKEIRIINVKGIDVEACCGMHVNNTGDIGAFKIVKRESVKDGVERLTYKVGTEALKYIQEREDIIKEASHALAVPEIELVKSTKRMWEQLKEARKSIGKANTQMLEDSSEALVKEAKKGLIVKHFQDANRETIVQLALGLTKKHSEIACRFTSGEGSVIVFSGVKSKIDANKELQNYFKKVKGKGGGNANVAQGIVFDKAKLK